MDPLEQKPLCLHRLLGLYNNNYPQYKHEQFAGPSINPELAHNRQGYYTKKAIAPRLNQAGVECVKRKAALPRLRWSYKEHRDMAHCLSY